MKTSRRVIAVYPTSRRFGFAVFEGDRVIDWGLKRTYIRSATTRAQELLRHYQPDLLILDKPEPKDLQRSAAARKLVSQLAGYAHSHKVRVRLIAWKHVRKRFAQLSASTLHEITSVIVSGFPDLGLRQPPRRKCTMPEHHNMPMFRAVAMGMVQISGRKNRYRTDDKLLNSPKGT